MLYLRWSACLISLLLLCGCGNKGNLILPDNEAADKKTSVAKDAASTNQGKGAPEPHSH